MIVDGSFNGIHEVRGSIPLISTKPETKGPPLGGLFVVKRLRCVVRWRLRGRAGTRYHEGMSERARRLLQDALSLPEDERLDLAEQLMSSLPADSEWMAELERRARGALADPGGGEAWDVVERRLAARIATR